RCPPLARRAHGDDLGRVAGPGRCCPRRMKRYAKTIIATEMKRGIMSTSCPRRKAIAALAAVLLPALIADVSPVRAADMVVVAVTTIDEHPALIACRNGIHDALKAAGYQDGKNLRFIYESAKGDPAAADRIARQFASDKPDVIVPISTPSALSAVRATIGIPVVFAAVTDPLGAKVVRGMY